MKNYLFLNLKGGSGKTTTAFLLIAALNNVGRTLQVTDVDPQGSLLSWLAIEGVIPGKSDIHIVDCPPRFDKATTAAIKNADTIIVPSSPSLAEVPVAKSTVEAIAKLNPGATVKILWNRVKTRTVASRQLGEYAEVIGVEALETQIMDRDCYQKLAGLGWKALNKAARTESLELALEVLA